MRKAHTPAVPLLALLALSVAVSLLPAGGARDVKPDGAVGARVEHGTLTAVTVTGPDGKPVGQGGHRPAPADAGA